jgi:hypothetical protein
VCYLLEAKGKRWVESAGVSSFGSRFPRLPASSPSPSLHHADTLSRDSEWIPRRNFPAAQVSVSFPAWHVQGGRRPSATPSDWDPVAWPWGSPLLCPSSPQGNGSASTTHSTTPTNKTTVAIPARRCSCFEYDAQLV